MECLQYLENVSIVLLYHRSFKPYYKWNAFNTSVTPTTSILPCVLNLIISGMPSILKTGELSLKIQRVLNLIISGMPSILRTKKELEKFIQF